jgi:hypothetical protein
LEVTIELSFEQFYVLALTFKKIPQISFHSLLLRRCHGGETNTKRWAILFNLM